MSQTDLHDAPCLQDYVAKFSASYGTGPHTSSAPTIKEKLFGGVQKPTGMQALTYDKWREVQKRRNEFQRQNTMERERDQRALAAYAAAGASSAGELFEGMADLQLQDQPAPERGEIRYFEDQNEPNWFEDDDGSTIAPSESTVNEMHDFDFADVSEAEAGTRADAVLLGPAASIVLEGRRREMALAAAHRGPGPTYARARELQWRQLSAAEAQAGVATAPDAPVREEVHELHEHHILVTHTAAAAGVHSNAPAAAGAAPPAAVGERRMVGANEGWAVRGARQGAEIAEDAATHVQRTVVDVGDQISRVASNGLQQVGGLISGRRG